MPLHRAYAYRRTSYTAAGVQFHSRPLLLTSHRQSLCPITGHLFWPREWFKVHCFNCGEQLSIVQLGATIRCRCGRYADSSGHRLPLDAKWLRAASAGKYLASTSSYRDRQTPHKRGGTRKLPLRPSARHCVYTHTVLGKANFESCNCG